MRDPIASSVFATVLRNGTTGTVHLHLSIAGHACYLDEQEMERLRKAITAAQDEAA
jgi:hypothetical protein